MRKQFTFFLLFTCSVTLQAYGQNDEISTDNWRKYVNIGFEFKMPHSSTSSLSRLSRFNEISDQFSDEGSYPLLRYRSNTKGFDCTVSVVAFEPSVLTAEKNMADRLLNPIKEQIDSNAKAKIIHESVDTIKGNTQLKLQVKGPLGTITIIYWVCEQYIISAYMEDVAPELASTKFFEESFRFYR